MLSETLQAAGYAVDCAADGCDALDGRQFLRVLHGRPDMVSVPVIVMSGDAVDDVEGVRLVRKPVDADVLLEVIDEMLHPRFAA